MVNSNDFWSLWAKEGRHRVAAGLAVSGCDELPAGPPIEFRAVVDGPGLVSDRISPRPLISARVEVCEGGLNVKRSGISPRVMPDTPRGAVFGFSTASRGRLIRRLMRLDWLSLISSKHADRVFGLFVTLTYPDVFSTDREVWKRDLDVITKRLVRDHAGFSCIWKMELKKRKSGVNAGQIAPHFHLLCWFPAGLDLAEFRDYISLSWFEVVGSNDDKHLRAGTQSIRCYGSVGKLMGYCSKYLAKDFPSDFETGRVWGEIGSFPRGDVFCMSVNYIEFLRRVRRWGRGSKYLSRLSSSRPGLALFGSFDGVLQLLRGLALELPGISVLERQNFLVPHRRHVSRVAAWLSLLRESGLALKMPASP